MIPVEQCAALIGHCFTTDGMQFYPAVAYTPEGGWPVSQTCRHCGKRRRKITTVTYEDYE